MRFRFIYLLASAIVLLFQSAYLENNVFGQQRPPLTVDINQECHIVDAVPLLVKNNYKAKNYQLTKLKTKPLIIQETINPSKDVGLRIEQRGCEDVYAKFDFAFRNKADRKKGIKTNLLKAAQIIKNLKLRRDALLDSQLLSQISQVLVKHSQKARPQNQLVVCLVKIPSECFSDISLKYEFPHLKLFYITRP